MRQGDRALKLLPPGALVKTGDVDHADWNFRPVLGRIMQLRFKLVAALLGDESCERLLEVGYGSGVLMPELKRHARELYGLDVHARTREVADALRCRGVNATLSTGSATAMPFEADFFDCAVVVSALEFVDDLDAACVELRRVLKVGGRLVVVTPGFSPLADFGLKIFTGKSAKDDFGERRRQILPTLRKYFAVERQLFAPPLGGEFVRLYTALSLRKDEVQNAPGVAGLN